ncbi:MAG: nitrogen fixation protein FixH [Pseudomonadota bacterium]|jgi:hypothetical protein
MSQRDDSKPAKHPWWSYGHVWLVIAGPLVVVVASFITYYLAAHGQDPVLMQSSVDSYASTPEARTTLAPAMQARNHATTGALPGPNSKK